MPTLSEKALLVKLYYRNSEIAAEAVRELRRLKKQQRGPMSTHALKHMMVNFEKTGPLGVLAGRGRKRDKTAGVEDIATAVVEASTESLHGISHCSATRWLLATDHVTLNHGQVTWRHLSWHPPLLTTTPLQRKEVSALDRFHVHRCPTRRVFSGTGLELMTRQATIRYLYHSATAAILYFRRESLKLKSSNVRCDHRGRIEGLMRGCKCHSRNGLEVRGGGASLSVVFVT
ncbi:uncharacterized protein TNCV_736571 [Trichonephila clavipes]|nr:uncharacterized protein TNCV_736571 [Trichonephila clavipes]